MTTDPIADICLVLEGTYPFVPGGVSSWVHQLVTRMPEIQFSIVHVSPRPGFYGENRAYDVPENVISVQEVFLQKPVSSRHGRIPKKVQRMMSAVCDAIEAMRRSDVERVLKLSKFLEEIEASAAFSSLDVLASEEHWRVLQRCYRDEASQISFLNFYWNWVFAHQPLINLLISPVPRAHAYHTVSTGYAGLLAGIAAERYAAPMILTEHGIYTKERRIEIHAAEWVPAGPEEVLPDIRAPYFRGFWNRHFHSMSKLCYEKALRIFTLYSGNKDEQVADGADPEKISIVPNGMDMLRFEAAADRYDARNAANVEDSRFTIGFVGRVCPIKDVRTFLAAMRLVADEIPDLDVRIMGPLEEDPEYVERCRSFIEGLGLADTVRFMGRVALDQELDQLDVMVLTSISEAQPLVILEAGAVGMPVVSTDVGSCAELLMGRSAEDRRIGQGGILTPIASPGATAKALLTLYADPDLRLRLGQNLKRRVATYFGQNRMIETYRSIYLDMMPVEVS